MATVLRILGHTDIVTSDYRLAPYLERCTARAAFRRALAAQLADFRQVARSAARQCTTHWGASARSLVPSPPPKCWSGPNRIVRDRIGASVACGGRLASKDAMSRDEGRRSFPAISPSSKSLLDVKEIPANGSSN